MRNPRGGPGRGRGELALVRRGAPTTAPSTPALRYVALGPLRAALDGVEWAPLRLATDRPARPASPRLPHALALHLAHAARQSTSGAVEVDELGAVVPDLRRLAALLGSDAAMLDGVLDALERAGVVAVAAQSTAERRGGAGGLTAVRLVPGMLGPAPRCAALDWAATATATAGSPSAWVAAHALAERLERHHWTPVPRADLEQTLGAGASGARGALERLVAAGVVERREQRGGVSVYRFAEALWESAAGTAGGLVPVGRAVLEASPRAGQGFDHRPAAVGPGPAAAAPAVLPAAGLRLVVGGVEVEVPAGMRARVDIGPDGRPTLTLLAGG